MVDGGNRLLQDARHQPLSDADKLAQDAAEASRIRELSTHPAVIALHVDAIARASSSAGEASKFGARVAVELGALVARKLGVDNAPKVKRA